MNPSSEVSERFAAARGNARVSALGASGASKGRLLNLGCGNRFHPAWLNVDAAPTDGTVLKHDLCKPLPFANETFAAVYHSHVLEHLPRERALPFLKECRRVLIPAGILRVAVPDLETLAALYLEMLRGALAGDQKCREHYEWATIELLDQLARQHADGGEMFKYLCRDPIPSLDFVTQRLGYEVTSKLEQIRAYVKGGLTPEKIEQQRATFGPEEVGRFRTSGEAHLWMYDRYSLGQLLEVAGFQQVQVMQAQTSRIPDFQTYKLDVLSDGSVRKPDSLFMEATRA
ncbi:MAG TPA: methyltransferase domain-containing protein [Candidatus Acidoferrum sp.]|nr:methyltransferase domain-containing protein [Candidatus Acidoferrum sp.]